MQALHNQTTDRPLTGLSRESQMPAMMAVLMVCLMEHWTACLTEFLFECLTERHWESVLTWTGPAVDASAKVLKAIDSVITHGIALTAELFPIASSSPIPWDPFPTFNDQPKDGMTPRTLLIHPHPSCLSLSLSCRQQRKHLVGTSQDLLPQSPD